jgi:Transposase DDE domain
LRMVFARLRGVTEAFWDAATSFIRRKYYTVINKGRFFLLQSATHVAAGLLATAQRGYFPLSHGLPRAAGGLSAALSSKEGCAARPWPAQNALQPFYPLEPARRVRPHLRGGCRRRAKAAAHHDRCRSSEGAPDRGAPLEKGAVPRRTGRTKGGPNTKLHAVCDGGGKPLVLPLSKGQMSDHKGARLTLVALPPASALIADLGYDSNSFREALAQ